MKRIRQILPAASMALWLATPGIAETPLAADFRGEGTRFTKSCSGFSLGMIASCAELLFTDHPLHIAVGSLAPGNGFGAGLSLVGHWTTANWRNTWNMDAVASPNGSWRAGGYVNLVSSKIKGVNTGKGRPKSPAPALDPTQEQPVFHLYAETDSLNKLAFFGLGPNTSDTARSYFGLRETIAGGSMVWPVLQRIHVAILAEANGRFVETRGSNGQASPSIEKLYTAFTAPGLATGTAFFQAGQGVRLTPTFGGGHVQLNYLVNYQEFIAPGDDQFSFQRFTTDLLHQFPIRKTVQAAPTKDFNGPDECTASAQDDDRKCPPLIAPSGPTRNLLGSFGLRFLLNESFVPDGNVVPFYFQPTLGGSDINGNAMLPSFQDYRYRAPNVMLLRASFEQPIYKWPVGVALMIDEGKVAQSRGDIDFSHLQHSYSAGLTLRAGGFPMVYLLFSWGGHEGTHTTGSMNTSLLGGGARPSLF
jgi:hypothetical protein